MRCVSWIALDRRERLRLRSVGERVEVHQRLGARGEPVEHESRSDEAAAARDEDHGGEGLFMPRATPRRGLPSRQTRRR